MAVSGELALEEVVYLSQDRLLVYEIMRVCCHIKSVLCHFGLSILYWQSKS